MGHHSITHPGDDVVVDIRTEITMLHTTLHEMNRVGTLLLMLLMQEVKHTHILVDVDEELRINMT